MPRAIFEYTKTFSRKLALIKNYLKKN